MVTASLRMRERMEQQPRRASQISRPPGLFHVVTLPRMTPQTPRVGLIVHYVSHGSPVQPDGTQVYPSVCRAAVIAEVYPEQPPAMLSGGEMSDGEAQLCALAVLNPTGIVFVDSPQDESDKVGGSWHWPERV
jgi:hypothetical protein